MGIEAKRIKATPIRKAIAKALTASWENVAYVNLVSEIDVTNLWELRSKIKGKILESDNVKLTFLPFIIKATVKAIEKFNMFNGVIDASTNEVIIGEHINIGIAVDTPNGLMVPVVKNAETLTLIEIAKEVNRLAKACLEKKIKMSEMQDSTFTITNYGSIDALFGVPIINYPNLAISGMGAIKDKVYVKNDKMVPGKVMYLTTASDHKWIDGGDIGRFNYEIRTLLEKPEILL